MRKNIKIKRKAKKITQEQFALILGISKSHMQKIEIGQRDPTLKLAKKIADALDCTSIDEILQVS